MFREKLKCADYILYLSANNSIAIVKAKDNLYSPKEGIEDDFLAPFISISWTDIGRLVPAQRAEGRQ